MIEINGYLLNIELISMIITPLISLIAVIIYAKALKNSTEQNKIILSQNIKANFEKEIHNLFNEGNEKSGLENENDAFKILNIFEGIFPLIRNLTNDEEFESDRVKKTILNEEKLILKRYNKNLFKIRSVVYENSKSAEYYKNLEIFLNNIESSQMIKEDKYSIKNQLRRNVLKETLEYYKSHLKTTHLTEMLIPLYEQKYNEIKWIKLNKSHLFNSIEKIIDNLEK
ncbi:hypothetical protein [Bizionia sp. M204]|uniref:hypothetical protein n=1 Tax=Bizionia sp. M204 TaxID=2675331 RepID=UPI002062CBC5|nr:hypothetical protein [Bizionia sp. M204]UPS91948.1 hypothetical protein GMA17_09565 [Bizionia sp. M204]